MTPLDELQIKEIAEQFDCGFNCFWNIKTNELIFVPDQDNGFMDTKFWKDDFKKIHKNRKNIVEIDKPDSNNFFEMMEGFVTTAIANTALKKDFYSVLNSNKPFRNFKLKIDNSEYREDWFAFKSKWIQGYVKTEIDFIMENQT